MKSTQIFTLFFIFHPSLYPAQLSDKADPQGACTKDEDCQKDIYCAGVKGCLSGSRCQNKFCECAAGHFGWHCEFASCADFDKCLNEGECLIVENKHICACKEDYSGENCEIYACNNQTNCPGVCSSESSCSCIDGLKSIAGGRCEEACVGNLPCQNSGACSVVDQRVKCTCPEGFVGRWCQNIRCTEETCPGICTDDEESECICPPGFFGDRCQYSSCTDFIGCDGVGKCDDSNNDIRCICDTKIYGGKFCEYNCTLPCVNGECGPDELCYCEPGFSGEQCELVFSITTMEGNTVMINFITIAIVTAMIVIIYFAKINKSPNHLKIGTFKFEESLNEYEQQFSK